jgi:midasin
MSQQSDSTDLLGGFKPVDALMLATPVKEQFDKLFRKTFSVKQNSAFLESIEKASTKQKWEHLVIGYENAIKMSQSIKTKQQKFTAPKKRKEIGSDVFIEWEDFKILVAEFKSQIVQVKTQFLFSFVEGSLVTALKNGHWILLDEINLATAETLECLSGLLQKTTGSVMLLERGDTVPVSRHPDFKLFACMNPATDAGKRDLPRGIRSRLTEFWIDAPDSNKADLHLIIKRYLYRFIPAGVKGEEMCEDIGKYYTTAKALSHDGQLFDGAEQRVHVSLRTLTRALSYSASIAPVYGIRRALYEGCFMTFMTGLSRVCFEIMKKLLVENILNNVRNPLAFISQIPQEPLTQNHVLVDSFWIEKGDVEIPEGIENEFVLTPSVAVNLSNLARGCLSRKYPILIQGPTSAGKTSMIEHLAKNTGHRFIRINNHEHTDLQEYLGGYMTNDQGRLVFQEGVLVEALRKGYWVVLDELNLAPSDVLEALNRLLDDNRELFLIEKQEVIKPHPHFMLFATQNPAGQYGGRKQLSKAFRNRFLELHFTDIPENELETIIEKRCRIAPSYSKKLVMVYKQLSKSRDASKVFDGRQSFITLRDLFRWALRKAVGYEDLARDGYMLIAERVRKPSDRKVIQNILEKELKVKLDPDSIYSTLFDEIIASIPNTEATLEKIVWTGQMRKLFVLIYKAKIHVEPVLLIGETGCGKTTVCQVLAELFNQKLHIVNAHQNSETSDFIGSQRPCRNREEHEKTLFKELNTYLSSKGENCDEMTMIEIENQIEQIKKINEELYQKLSNLLIKTKSLFEWYDGPLVQAMKQGSMFLLDEISLADDSVLERLNSVLEPLRQLTLVEKSGTSVAEIKAHECFHFFATMNPGGDYGKKELSPALRNRFTEIWVPQVSNIEDLRLIIEKNLGIPDSDLWAKRILEFLEWYANHLQKSLESIISLRDILAWSGFIKSLQTMGIPEAFYHGGCMVLIDGIGVNPLFGALRSPMETKEEAQKKLSEIAKIDLEGLKEIIVETTNDYFGASPFVIPFGKKFCREMVPFSLKAPTTLENCIRVLRAVQLSKPVLLEGSPGAGKTALITSMAEMSRNGLVRINLSEQTDLMDLFGSDLPVEGGNGGEFKWRDGPFLKAMQDGEWVLLDELNLASQQVLEGLNACLDHRATVYIPELDKHFSCHPEFRVFAAQNPQSQGGGRKGLPKSFVNRFTLVYVQELKTEDLQIICSSLFPYIDAEICNKMIEFNHQMKVNTMDLRSFGWLGSPWEFNLRDILRWLDLWQKNGQGLGPGEFLNTLYIQRMRTKKDRDCVLQIFQNIFGYTPKNIKAPYYTISDTHVIIGSQFHRRSNNRGLHSHSVPVHHLQILPSSLSILESLLRCVETKTMALLIGPAASGKSSIVRLLASLCGEKLEEFSMNPGVDALEILGGFEQVDYVRRKQQLLRAVDLVIEPVKRNLFLSKEFEYLKELTNFWTMISTLEDSKFVVTIQQLILILKPLIDQSEIDSLNEIFIDYQNLIKSDARGKFEWMDSALVNALEFGHWILIDNVNLCSSSVLDRLNSLLEVGGVLHMSERGLINNEIKCITPHPNFRIFMAMDPRHGEISRAMRNRAIELYVTDFEKTIGIDMLNSMKVLGDLGLPGTTFAKKFINLTDDEKLCSTELKMIVEKFNTGQDLDVFQEPDLDLAAPTVWPDFVSGRMLINHPEMANAMLHGSLLYHYLSEDVVKIYSERSFEHSPNRTELIRASAQKFCKQFSESNRTSLSAYIDFLCEEFPDSVIVPIFGSMKYDRKELWDSIHVHRESILTERNFEELSSILVIFN